MAENSKISWTDDTLNVQAGCNEVVLVLPDGTRVPSECDNCYAKVWARRRFEGGHRGQDAAHAVLWGNPKTTPRQQMKNWRGTLRRIERNAAETGRRLCFAYSLGDVFEEHPMVGLWRDEFLHLAAEHAVHIDWLLLTKRPQNVLRMVPERWQHVWPRNVWIGYSAGTQEAMNRRAHYGAEIRAVGCPVVFVSIEPQLEYVDPIKAILNGANWLITGGESGNGEDRPRIDAKPEWFREVRDAALDVGISYFHKQSSGNRPGLDPYLDGRLWHQWPDTGLGPLGGVRANESAELVKA